MFLALICGLSTQQVLNVCIQSKELSVFVVMAAGFPKASFADVISMYLI